MKFYVYGTSNDESDETVYMDGPYRSVQEAREQRNAHYDFASIMVESEERQGYYPFAVGDYDNDD